MSTYRTMFKKIISKINYEQGDGYQLGDLIQFNGMLHRPSKLRVLNWWSEFSIIHSSMLNRYEFWITGNFVTKKFSTWDIDLVIRPKGNFYVSDEYSDEDSLQLLENDLKNIMESSLNQPEPFKIDVFYSNNWEPWPDDLNQSQFINYANQTMIGLTIINEVIQHGIVTHDYANMTPAPVPITDNLYKRETRRLSQKHIDKYLKLGKFWKDPLLMNHSMGTNQPSLPNIPIENCNKKEIFVALKDSLQIKNLKALPARSLNTSLLSKNKSNLVHRDGIIGQCINKNKLKNNKITELIHNAETKLTRFQSKNTTKDNNMNMMDSDKNPVTGDKLFTSGFEFKTIIAGEMYSPGNLLWEEYKGEYHTHQNGEICAGPHDEMKIIKRRLLVRLTESKGENQ